MRFEKRAPLSADSLAVRIGGACPICNRQFHAGDETTTIPVHELAPNVFAHAIAHFKCAVDSYAEFAQRQNILAMTRRGGLN